MDRLAILGAGNCNDLDLHRLLTRASRIQLVDLDGEALHEGVARQALTRSRRIEQLTGVDVTGAASAPLQSSSHLRSVTDTDLDQYQHRLGYVPSLPDVAGCDVIVSACLLSQLVSSLVDLLGPEHPRLLGLTQLVRDQHLRALTTHLASGGRALLASDFVSSDTCPAVLGVSDDDVESLATAALHDRNFFTGTNPLIVMQRLQQLAETGVDDVRLLRPWRWRISDRRAFLVYALTFRGV